MCTSLCPRVSQCGAARDSNVVVHRYLHDELPYHEVWHADTHIRHFCLGTDKSQPIMSQLAPMGDFTSSLTAGKLNRVLTKRLRHQSSSDLSPGDRVVSKLVLLARRTTKGYIRADLEIDSSAHLDKRSKQQHVSLN